jgi:AraC family transcriptional regulator
VLSSGAGSQVRVDQWDTLDSESFPHPVAHPSVELVWVETGRARYRVGPRELILGPGAVAIIPSAVDHATWIAGGTRAGVVHLGCELWGEIAEAVGPGLKGVRLAAEVIGAPGPLLRLGQLMLAEAARTAPGQPLVLGALGEALAVELLRGGRTDAPPAARDPRLTRAVDLIEGRFRAALTVDDIAAAAAMSRYHFSRAFRRQFGMSPYQYLLRTRLAHAASLLRRGGHSVSEAALSSGFSDLSRFGQLFRRQLGCAPSELRRPTGARSAYK